jgi:hypothetical protein
VLKNTGVAEPTAEENADAQSPYCSIQSPNGKDFKSKARTAIKEAIERYLPYLSDATAPHFEKSDPDRLANLRKWMGSEKKGAISANFPSVLVRHIQMKLWKVSLD